MKKEISFWQTIVYVFLAGFVVSNAITLYFAIFHTGREISCFDICATLPPEYQTTSGYLAYIYSPLLQGSWFLYAIDMFQYFCFGVITYLPILAIYHILYYFLNPMVTKANERFKKTTPEG